MEGTSFFFFFEWEGSFNCQFCGEVKGIEVIYLIWDPVSQLLIALDEEAEF